MWPNPSLSWLLIIPIMDPFHSLSQYLLIGHAHNQADYLEQMVLLVSAEIIDADSKMASYFWHLAR